MLTSNSNATPDRPPTKIGFVHPGQMGSAMAACVTGSALWASEGRSEQSVERAHGCAMTDMGTLPDLAQAADVMIAICPPDAATAVATAVKATGFDGLYVDANAVAPTTSRHLATLFPRYVDAAVVGPPPGGPFAELMASRLYLSGEEADTVAALWAGSALEPRVVGTEPGAASALKMGYASFTKGTSALVLTIAAFAEAEGVADALLAEFADSQPAFAKQRDRACRGAVPKAWRFAGEMDEIASAYEAADLDAGYWAAAAATYRRLADFKNADPAPDIDDVLAALTS